MSASSQQRPLLLDASHPPTLEHITKTLQRVALRSAASRARSKDNTDDDDELVTVVRLPHTNPLSSMLTLVA
jgi:hypothetical protein